MKVGDILRNKNILYKVSEVESNDDVTILRLQETKLYKACQELYSQSIEVTKSQIEGTAFAFQVRVSELWQDLPDADTLVYEPIETLCVTYDMLRINGFKYNNHTALEKFLTVAEDVS